MDWIIDTSAPDAAGHATELLVDHLVRHADGQTDATSVRDQVRAEVDAAVRSCAGRPLHLLLDWTSGPAVLTCSAVDADLTRTGVGPVAAAHRAGVRALSREVVGRTELRVQRRGMRTYDAGPPPVVGSARRPRRPGPGRGRPCAVGGDRGAPHRHAPADGRHRRVHPRRFRGPRARRRRGRRRRVRPAAQRARQRGLRRRRAGRRRSSSQSPAARSGSPGRASSLCHVSSGLAGQLGARVSRQRHRRARRVPGRRRPGVPPAGAAGADRRPRRRPATLLAAPRRRRDPDGAQPRPLGQPAPRERERARGAEARCPGPARVRRVRRGRRRRPAGDHRGLRERDRPRRRDRHLRGQDRARRRPVRPDDPRPGQRLRRRWASRRTPTTTPRWAAVCR